MDVKDAAAAFLACRRVAVTGVSRHPTGHGGNTVYKRLRDRGYEVFAVNPNAIEVEGDPCFTRLADIPGGVQAVVIATRPEVAEATVRDCIDLGIGMVWMHRSSGTGSVCESATTVGREHGITVIDGGCPLMFPPASDVVHKVMRWMGTRSGAVPKQV